MSGGRAKQEEKVAGRWREKKPQRRQKMWESGCGSCGIVVECNVEGIQQQVKPSKGGPTSRYRICTKSFDRKSAEELKIKGKSVDLARYSRT